MTGIGKRNLSSSSELNQGILWVLNFKTYSFTLCKQNPKPNNNKAHTEVYTVFDRQKHISFSSSYIEGSDFFKWSVRGTTSFEVKTKNKKGTNIHQIFILQESGTRNNMCTNVLKMFPYLFGSLNFYCKVDVNI